MKHYNFKYFIHEGVRGIFLNGFMSFAAVGIIVACLIIMGSFTLLSVNIDGIINRVESENEILAYIDESYTVEQAQALAEKISSVENVTKCEFVSSEQALADYRTTLGEEGTLLDGLDENPLRHRYRIYLADISLMEQTAAHLENITGVASVNARLDISNSFMTARRIVDLVSLCLVVILLSVSVFIISNTIKLATFDRREEIAIMKMVGATNGFIRWPFLVEGLILGILGSTFAFFIQWGIYAYVTQSLLSGFDLFDIISFSKLALPIAGAFAITGFAAGVGGSLLTIRRFLKV